MTFNASEAHVDFDLDLIIRAIAKAISEDVPNQLHEHHLETNNYIGLMRGDFINENLRNFALVDGYDLLPIQRYGWRGRLLVNHEKHITLSIVTQSNLHMIPRKKRARPHYTMSILKMQNGDLQGRYVQQTLFSVEPFDNAVLEEDYESMMCGAVDPAEGYHHYFIAYRAEASELVDVKLVLMDPMFNVVQEESLNHLIVPDFARLTATDDSETATATATEETHRKATRQLSKLKLGLRKAEEQA
jgi:hypothetical protein